MASVFKRARKNGGHSWYVRYKDPYGRDIKEKVPARTKREAELFLAKIIQELESGELEKRIRQQDVSLFQILDDFVAYGKAHKRSWARDVNSIYHIKRFFGDNPLNMITPARLEQYISWRKSSIGLKGKPAAPATINRELSCLKTAFNRAIRDEKASTNPVQRIKFLEEDNIRNRVLGQEEYEKLLELSPAHLKPVLVCAYETGMRLGEILGLSWNQVDLKKRVIILEGSQTKTGKGRIVPISPELHKVLSPLPRINESVFTYRGNRIQWIKRSFTTACESAGIRNFRFHDFRHTFVTRMRRKGVPDRVIMAITGHKTLAMLHRYDRIDEEDLLRAVG